MKRLLSYFVSISIIGVAFAMGCLGSNVFAQPGGGGAIVAIEEGAGSAASTGGEKAGTGAGSKKYTTQVKSPKGGGAKAGRSKTPGQLRSPEPKPYNGSILGDKYTFLNFEVISAAKPIYRRVAKQAGASGLVQVEVLINENGDVINAKARTGNKLLWDEAEAAALASKFNRPTDNGRPARAMGFLVYRFGKGEDDDDEP
jgi:outer membrane biosynthesis protein TonB